MKRFIKAAVILIIFCCGAFCTSEEGLAKMYLNTLNKKMLARANRDVQAQWLYYTNITDENLENLLITQNDLAKEIKDDWHETIKFKWKEISDPDIRRQFDKYTKLGLQALSTEKYYTLNRIINEMEEIYSTATVCSYNESDKCNLKLDPDIIAVMLHSRDPDELKHYWKEWRKAIGGNLRERYKRYVELMNEAAILNNKTDASELWLSTYETGNIKQKVEQLWIQVKPLYLQLHAYIRYKLHELYGNIVPLDGPIPAHLLGNMWSQSWTALTDYTKPLPEKKTPDITPDLQAKGYKPIKMFQLAETFMVSINLSQLSSSFWESSMFEKPSHKEVVCHPSVWNFYSNDDFRVKLCAQVTQYYYTLAHNMVSQIEYYKAYKHLPYVYRESSNEAFTLAVGDVITLSVLTEKHLHQAGIISEPQRNTNSALNYLFAIGLDKIAFLPYAYIVDLWRWGVFSGNITNKHYNCRWWGLRHEYQGVQPPTQRSETHLDVVSKFHVLNNEPYIPYFLSFILQFQFHMALCRLAGEYDTGTIKKPLHECNIYGSKPAGNALKAMMQLGSSKPWPEALNMLTGQKEMSADALLEYFSPLMSWLTMENRRNGVTIGWGEPTSGCS